MSIVIVGTTAVITMALCLLLHYEVLRLLFVHSSKLKHQPRVRVGVVFATLITTHLIEIWIFAFGYLLLNGRGSLGHIEHSITHFLDYVYFSASVYTLLAFGEYLPVGPLALLRRAGIVLRSVHDHVVCDLHCRYDAWILSQAVAAKR